MAYAINIKENIDSRSNTQRDPWHRMRAVVVR